MLAVLVVCDRVNEIPRAYSLAPLLASLLRILIAVYLLYSMWISRGISETGRDRRIHTDFLFDPFAPVVVPTE